MMQRAALLVALAPLAVSAGGVPEPEGYREAPYRAPVPVTLRGATVVGTAAAHALWRAGEVAFIDVLPRDARPENLPEGTIWRDRPRRSIPGATWLPNTGYAELSPAEEAYFRAGIEAATGADADRGVLFFCLSECWMSWNAARRAVEMGRDAVYWYPDGTDGWSAAGHPLVEITPAEAPS